MAREAEALALARGAARGVLKGLRATRLEAEVVLLDPRQSRSLNARFRGRPRAADVLSFPSPGSAPGGTVGTLFLAPAVVRHAARRHGLSFRRWLRELAVHGTLHLLGYHHDDPAAARLMAALQRALLRKAA